jgi:glutathione S-transferase
MTFTLYWRKRTGAFAPAALLAEARQRWTGVYVDSAKGENLTAEYKRLNPMARIPTLILPDGQVMTESLAMVLHLAEFFEEAELLPPVGDRERPQALRWLAFGAVNLYETDLRLTFPDRYTAATDGAEGVRQAARRDFDRQWAMVGDALEQRGEGPFFLGRRYSALDPYYAMLAAWHERPKELLARYPRLAALVEATVARPAIAPLWHAYDLDRDL